MTKFAENSSKANIALYAAMLFPHQREPAMSPTRLETKLPQEDSECG